MALTPVTPVQQRVIDALIAKGRVDRVPADLAKAKIFVRQAQDVITDLPHLTKAQNRYNLAYDACHDVGEAVLAAHGYRTLSGPGQHEAIGLLLCAVIDKPPGDQDARRFDQIAAIPQPSAVRRPSGERSGGGSCRPNGGGASGRCLGEGPTQGLSCLSRRATSGRRDRFLARIDEQGELVKRRSIQRQALDADRSVRCLHV